MGYIAVHRDVRVYEVSGEGLRITFVVFWALFLGIGSPDMFLDEYMLCSL